MDYKISILTSIFNGKDFIRGFLEDITRQTIFDQCQLIMVDANSSEYLETEKCIFEYTKKYKNIEYHKIVNEDGFIPNVYTVWNLIIKDYAKAELLSNANIDDRKHPRHLELHLKTLEENPSASLAYASVLETSVPNETFENNTANIIMEMPEFTLDHLLRVNMPHNNPVWRADLHLQYGFFNDDYFSAGDYEMWLRAAIEGEEFIKICNEPLSLYYRNPKGISSNKKTLHKAIAEVRSVIEKYILLYKQKKSRVGKIGLGNYKL